LAIAATAGVLVACSDDASRPADGVDAGARGAFSLYQRLGGKAGLESFVKTVVEAKIESKALSWTRRRCRRTRTHWKTTSCPRSATTTTTR
jgi:hypothetical protein